MAGDSAIAAPPPPTPARGFRVADLLAGLAVAGVLLPEAVAYAAIAGVPPLHALLAALVGLCVYPLLGSSRFAIVAPTSSAAAIFASAAAVGGPAHGYALVLLTGALFVLAALLKADFLGAFISRPVLRGFAWALAVTIALKQVPHILGVSASAPRVAGLLRELWAHAAQVHLASLWLGLGALLLWLVLHHGLRRRLFVPPSLLVLLAGLGVSASWPLPAHGVALVGPIAWQPLALQWPDLTFEQWLRQAQVAPALLLILFAESWGSVRSLALQNGDAVRTRRELLALGGSNLASGLLQGLPVGAGFSAAAANASAGAGSKAAGVAAAGALALLLWWGRPALALLPVPVLAAVVIGILSHNLWPKSVIASLRLGSDAWLALAAAAGVLLLGPLNGMLLAVGLSLLLAVRRFAQPLVAELGRLPGTHDYLDVQRHAGLEPPPPGLLVMRPEEPLFFANAEQVLQRVRERAVALPARMVILSMEMCDDLDSTSVEALGELQAWLSPRGVPLLLARLKDRPRAALERAGLAHSPDDARNTLFWSVDDAAQAAAARLAQAPASA